MPVITRIMTADRASRRSARSSVKSPAVIHVNRVWLICRFSGAIPIRARTCIAAIANDATITAVARPPDTDFGSRFPKKALTRKPTNGSKGISASTGSPFQGREGFGVERFAMPEQRNDQREADSRLGGGDRHHEERDDLAIVGAELPPEGNKREVDGVQHDLDRQQHRDQVLAQEHAGGADCEQQAGEHQVMTDRHGYSSLLRAS